MVRTAGIGDGKSRDDVSALPQGKQASDVGETGRDGAPGVLKR